LLSISRQTMHNEKSYHESFYIDFDIKNKNKLNKIDNDDLSDNTLLSNPDNLSEDFENKFNLEDVINKANSKFNEYDYNTAINLYLTVLESLDKSSQENIAVEIYHKLIIAYKKLSSYDNCLEYLSLLEDYYKNTNDVVKSIEIKLEIADVYYHMYNIKKSLAILSEIQNNNDNLPQILLFTIYLKSADIYSSLSNYDLADKNYLNALNSITNDIPDYLLEKLYFQYGLLKDDSGLTNDAIYYYNKCVELQNTSSMYFPSAYFNLGLISKYKNDLSNAIKYFKYALDADTQTNNFEGIYSSALELAKINLKENPKESLLYLKTAKNCSEYLNDTLSIATVGLMLGDFYYACNDVYIREFK